jgi:tetratricopeptide (TPR) repeat protein
VYTPREVAEIVGLQESRVRYWAQTGFVGPSEQRGGKRVYSFQDLVGVKAAKELLERGMSVQRVRKNLEALRAQLPQIDRPLAQLRILSDGDRLLIADEHALLEPLSGQMVMDFQLGALEGRVAEVMTLSPAAAPADAKREARLESAWAWFQEGVRLDGEEGGEDEALIAYQKALDGDPLLAAAHTNLGNLLHRRGAPSDARAHYEEALRLDPEQPEARYNLANLLEESGEKERAIAEWYRVVSACPEFADAHFNLATALYREGTHVRARAHLLRYLELDGDGEWAERARALLEALPE